MSYVTSLFLLNDVPRAELAHAGLDCGWFQARPSFGLGRAGVFQPMHISSGFAAFVLGL